MRNLIFIILALGLSVTACSKKKSTTTVAPPPVVDDDDGGGYVPGGVEDAYYSGYVNVYNKSVYKNLLYNRYNQTSYTYSYNVNCDINFFRWIFNDGNIVDCDSSNGNFDQLANAPVLIELLFKPAITRTRGGNTYKVYPVEGLVVANPSQNYPPYYAHEIPFEGELVELSDGRYLIEAGAIALLTKNSTDIDTFVLYHVWYEGSQRSSAPFGEVTIQ